MSDAERAGKYSVEDNQPALLISIVKGVLNSQQRVRTLEGVMQDVFLVKADNPVIKGLLAVQDDYYSQVKESSNHALGDPVPYLWKELVKLLMEQDIGRGNREALKALHTAIENMEVPAKAHDQVRVIALKPCYDQLNYKLTVVITDRAARQSITAAIGQLDWDHKSTKPPPGPVEDDLEKWLQSLELSSKR